jgi:hypothetical protein
LKTSINTKIPRLKEKISRSIEFSFLTLLQEAEIVNINPRNFKHNICELERGENMENQSEREKKIIESFQQDEQMMAHVFAQWCINNDLNPEEVYAEAYGAADNPVLQEAVKLTVSKEEAGPIETETLLGVLALFGNHDLAEAVTNRSELINRKEE